MNSGVVTVSTASNGAGTSGLGVTALADQTVNVSATGYRLASTNLASQTINLGAARVGGATLSQGLTISNTQTADGYSEGLSVSTGSVTGGFGSVSGVTNLAAGSSTSQAVTLNTSTAGTFTGTASLNLVSTGATTSGLGDTSIGTANLTLNGKVYAAAVADTQSAVNFGVVHKGDTVAAQNISVGNTATGALTDVVTGGISGVTGSAFSGSGTLGSGVASGQTNNTALSVGLNTSQTGSFSGSASLALNSHTFRSQRPGPLQRGGLAECPGQ